MRIAITSFVEKWYGSAKADMAETQPYEFDRFVGRTKMADGARIFTAKTLEEALRIAKSLFPDSPDSRFVLRDNSPRS